ncbi:unnamed protein product [Ilex paraguariensis]|uniref:Uncharacterized protein n=1 Tax=Ilex paraguariensis TaxID=185542 RepID=A0ABC8TZD0_9AQUA
MGTVEYHRSTSLTRRQLPNVFDLLSTTSISGFGKKKERKRITVIYQEIVSLSKYKPIGFRHSVLDGVGLTCLTYVSFFNNCCLIGRIQILSGTLFINFSQWVITNTILVKDVIQTD